MLSTQAVRSGSASTVEEQCGELFSELSSASSADVSIPDIRRAFASLEDKILETLIILGIKDENDLLPAALSEKDDSLAVPQLEESFLQFCTDAARRIKSFNKENSGKNIERLIEYINNHLSDDISLQDLADHCQISPSYVSRLFKERLNIGFVEYLNTMRVHRAQRLLEETGMSVEQIGYEAGFNNVRSFIRTFKKNSGFTPGQFRSSRAQTDGNAEKP